MLIKQVIIGKHILIKEAYLWDFLRRKNKHYHFLLMINEIQHALYVVIFQKDILFYIVSHDEDDGMWQFLCGSNHNIEDASIVSLFEVYNIDYSICLLKDMPRGYYAIRENVESDWIVKK